MKRLFLALEVPDFEKCDITLWREQALPELSASVFTDNLHLTLCFLGNTELEIEQELIAKLNHLKVRKIHLFFTGIGYFKKPKVLCLKPENTPHTLLNLVQNLNEMESCTETDLN